ncbi:hypothetical protein COHA_001055 [Chlorella ohadii]|uniref:Uncharacterized protein n=1 Tax=Chlorella ohadii TaxID=2649997 RepID=A0AAD5DZ39_9CHLO|nr:hypothetical protein COHA_001055 [Chlorella ohadii]
MRLTLPAWLAADSSGSSGGSGPASSSGPAGPQRGSVPPPGAEPHGWEAAQEASRDAGRKIARAFAASAEELDIPPGEVPKPYTVPPGYKAPTLGEQFRYAATKHPYARFGYAGAVLLGLLGWAIATEEKKHPHEPLGAHKRQQQHEGGGIGSK